MCTLIFTSRQTSDIKRYAARFAFVCIQMSLVTLQRKCYVCRYCLSRWELMQSLCIHEEVTVHCSAKWTIYIVLVQVYVRQCTFRCVCIGGSRNFLRGRGVAAALMTTFYYHSVRKRSCSPKNGQNDLYGKISDQGVWGIATPATLPLNPLMMCVSTPVRRVG